jgi:guanyl-specific ribonuclease Sa
MALFPAKSEPQLANAATAARLAVIIDLLCQWLGIDPSSTTSLSATRTTTNSADMSAADAAITPAPTATKKVIVDSVLINVGATAMSVTLKEETSGTVIAGPFYMAANSNLNVPISGTQLPTADKRLMGRTSAAGNITIVTQSHSSP